MTEPCWGGAPWGEKRTNLSLHAEDPRLEALAGVGSEPEGNRKPGVDRGTAIATRQATTTISTEDHFLENWPCKYDARVCALGAASETDQ